MNIRWPRWMKGLSLGVVMTAAVCPLPAAMAQDASPATSQASANAAVDRLADSIVFYAGYESTLNAEMTPASPKPQVNISKDAQVDLEKVFRPGVVGQGVASGPFEMSYSLGDRGISPQTGAMLIWLSAAKWEKTDKDVGYYFVMRLQAGNRQLMIGRMGGIANRQSLYAHMQAGDQKASARMGSTLAWEEDQWHLLVLNWGPNWVEFSVDGALPVRSTLGQEVEAHGESGRVTLSSRHAEQPFLLDEAMVLSRPLTGEEIQALYKQRPQAPAKEWRGDGSQETRNPKRLIMSTRLSSR